MPGAGGPRCRRPGRGAGVRGGRPGRRAVHAARRARGAGPAHVPDAWPVALLRWRRAAARARARRRSARRGVPEVRVGIADGRFAARLARPPRSRGAAGRIGRVLRAVAGGFARAARSSPTCSPASGCARSARSPRCRPRRCSPASARRARGRTAGPVASTTGRSCSRPRPPTWWRPRSSTHRPNGSTSPRSRARAWPTGSSPGSTRSASRAPRVVIEAETEHGEHLARCWRHEGALTPAALAERVRWQLDGWLTSEGHLSGGLTLLRLVPDEVVPATGRQLGFWGGDQAAADRADRALARVQGMLGPDSVVTVVPQGGRTPAERVRWVPWGEPREPGHDLDSGVAGGDPGSRTGARVRAPVPRPSCSTGPGARCRCRPGARSRPSRPRCGVGRCRPAGDRSRRRPGRGPTTLRWWDRLRRAAGARTGRSSSAGSPAWSRSRAAPRS